MRTAVLVLTEPTPDLIAGQCRRAPGLETGGLLLLRERPDERVVIVTGPGPAAQLRPASMTWDPSFIAGCLTMADAFGAEILGRWHRHCGPVLLASEEDRQGAEAFRQAIGADELVDLIVATEHDVPIGWAAYLCKPDGYERIRVDIPEPASR